MPTRVRTFQICDCEITNFEKMSSKVVAAKNFMKN